MRPAVALAALFASSLAAQPAATYEVTFEATWSAVTFPEDFPPNPHFSRLVGAAHAPEAVLWEPGGTATAGVEQMAETGGVTMLQAEVEALAVGGVAARELVGGNLPLSPGTTVMTVDLDADAPLLTLVTMVAPSPDWFVGVSGLDLRDGDGWVDERTVDLYVYDAGTDSGPTYTSPDEDTDPQEPIARIEVAPFLVGGRPAPVGTFTFRRLGASSTGPGPGALAVGEVVPNPVAGAVALAVTVPEAGPRRVRVVDALGREVYAASGAAGSGTVRIPTAGWAPGVYVVEVEAGGARAVRTFTVAR